MAEVRPGKIPAGVVVQPFDDRAGVVPEPLVPEIDRAVGSEDEPVPGDPGRQDAVEHVHTEGDHLQDLGRSPEPHRVPRAVGRKKGRRRTDLLQHFRFRLAYTHSADRISREIQCPQCLGRLAAQVVKSGALDDCEEVVALRQKPRLFGDPLALDGPLPAPLDRGLASLPCAGPRWTFVEDHGDVGAQVCLDRHDFAGPEEELRTIQVGGEGDAVVPDVAEFREAENLKTPTVREDRSIPSHEAVQPAEVADEFAARPQVQVVGVAKDDLGADFKEVDGGDGLDRSLGADGHEDRGLDGAVKRLEPAAAGRRRGVGLEELEGGRHLQRGKDLRGRCAT